MWCRWHKQDQVVQVGAPAVPPVQHVVGVQVRVVGAAGGAAVAVLAVQQGAVLLVGDQALAASDVEYVGVRVREAATSLLS